ncbi:hypothetical protein PFY12_14510 [Chryseobacterium camelliae]|uniref:Uncharacterized protein n=1 Tax=Chryseobacterium camelliae TaxID=1265445 RepID=A0ABY7QMM7_9FLAO|nr:hypothetical protein [Chryseobacterium camelliae]WBV60237.1 hypothetical protein PFY12_14510 [Chryseobacterium camelliae]
MTKKDKIYEEWEKVGIKAPANINGWIPQSVAHTAILKNDYEIEFDYKIIGRITYARLKTLNNIEHDDNYTK